MISYPVGDSGQTLIFARNVLEHMDAHRQTSWRAPEAGGQLFARIDGPRISIVEATGPRPTDRRRRCSYVPDRKAEQAEIDQRFRLGLQFIGDWHTHPEEWPRPSSIDLANVTECVSRSTHNLGGFVLAIRGTGTFPQGLFVGIASTSSIADLHPDRQSVSTG
ncbi:Mov34/MPN/PAD-1 family protein [Pseudohoeflea sp. DP4N28-3]|uniref:Mov34/MPN/PAD-1 family protein n=2 Tax=Pseudohoeflea coraliihabitans TaxID=2860393 RepID=A0ABS6WS73_9HYPH|nr:Mov34/MPN/PAD-1 family protein [Pseudohoeflea sp. DP4N28-3]